MNKYEVEIRADMNDCWDADAVSDYVNAESAAEAVELAKDWLIEHCDTPEEIEKIEAMQFRVRRHTEWDEEDDEWKIF